MRFYGEPMEKPENMSLKAQLAWDYFGLTDGRDFAAICTGDDAILLVDESRDLSGAPVFSDKESFVAFLEENADIALFGTLECGPDTAYLGTWVDKRILTPEVIKAVTDALNADSEEREEAKEAEEQDG